ncbi:MAG: heavy-metal-associated domain-containing protein [Rikenellaceae bacterium]
MKKIKLLLIACLMIFIATESFASPKEKKDNIATIEFLTDITCEKCVKKIMEFMPFQKGVKDVEVVLEERTVTVRYDKRKTSVEELVVLFKKIDVSAEPIEAAVQFNF